MIIKLNVQEVQVDKNVNLTMLLKKYNLSPDKLAIELNLSIIATEDYEKTYIKQGDIIEIVEFVGGG